MLSLNSGKLLYPRWRQNRDTVASATPQAAVISVGYNYYGHPSDEVIALLADAGAEVYRTDECGAITVNMDLDGDYEITTFREAAE